MESLLTGACQACWSSHLYVMQTANIFSDCCKPPHPTQAGCAACTLLLMEGPTPVQRRAVSRTHCAAVTIAREHATRNPDNSHRAMVTRNMAWLPGYSAGRMGQWHPGHMQHACTVHGCTTVTCVRHPSVGHILLTRMVAVQTSCQQHNHQQQPVTRSTAHTSPAPPTHAGPWL